MQENKSESTVGFGSAAGTLKNITRNPEFLPESPPGIDPVDCTDPKPHLSLALHLPLSDERFVDVAERYLASADKLIVGAASRLHVAVAKSSNRPTTKRGRDVHLAMEDEALAEAIADHNGNRMHHLDCIVVIDEDAAERITNEPDLTEMVAADLADAMERLYPIKGTGPVAKFLPHLVRMVGAAILGSSANLGDSDEVMHRAGECALMELAEQSGIEPCCVAAVHPAFPVLREAIAASAYASAKNLSLPVDRDMLAGLIRRAVAEGFASVGGRVTKLN